MTLGTTKHQYRRAGLAELIPNPVVREAGSYLRVPAQIIGADDEVLRCFAAVREASPVDLGAVASGTLHNVIVVGGGMVLTDDGYVVSESLNCIQNLAEYRGFRRSADRNVWRAESPLDVTEYVPAVPGRQHVLLKSAWDANYGHWLFDTLSSLPLVSDVQLSGRPLFVVNDHSGAMAKVIVDSLRLAGYSADDIIHHNFDVRRYESLTVLGSLTRHPVAKSPLAMKHLDDLAASVVPGITERVYLTRNAYTRRRLVNEDVLWPIFERHGFARITPESLTLEEQIALFKGALVVAGNLGASFSNLAFSPKGVTVLALTTTSMKHDFFYDIVCLKQGRYIALQGLTADPKPSLSSDFHVEGHSLGRLLAQLEEPTPES